MNIPNEAFTIEKQLIGDLFCDDEEAVSWLLSNCEAESFENGDLKRIFQAVKFRFENGKSIDAISVQQVLINKGYIGLAKAIFGICQEWVCLGDYKEHLRLHNDGWIHHKSLRFVEDLYGKGGDYSNAEFQEQISNFLDNNRMAEQKQPISAVQGLDYYLEHSNDEIVKYETGFELLDEHLKITPGDYVVIGARPSVGKTAFALQCAWNMSEKCKVLFFSFETSQRKIFTRIISNVCSVDFSAVSENRLSESLIDLVEFNRDHFQQHDFSVIEAAGFTVKQIKAEAQKHKADVIFIDYLGLISSEENEIQSSSYERMTKISKDIHDFAQLSQISIVALSQLNRSGAKEIDITSLRDSGQVEQDADAVLLLNRLQVLDNPEDLAWRELQIAKNKEGELGKIVMRFEGTRQNFAEAQSGERPDFVK